MFKVPAVLNTAVSPLEKPSKILVPEPKVIVEVDPRYFRPTEVDLLIGDPSKARRVLGWQHQVTFHQLVAEMVEEDLKVIAEESRVRGMGNE